jgi:hypothetical protein
MREKALKSVLHCKAHLITSEVQANSKYACLKSQVKKVAKIFATAQKTVLEYKASLETAKANSDRAECIWFVNKLQPISVGIWS